jgi:hypothetical protein
MFLRLTQFAHISSLYPLSTLITYGAVLGWVYTQGKPPPAAGNSQSRSIPYSGFWGVVEVAEKQLAAPLQARSSEPGRPLAAAALLSL